MKRACKILIYKGMINGEFTCRRQAGSICSHQKVKFKQMKRACKILIYKGMINGEQHLFPPKSKI